MELQPLDLQPLRRPASALSAESAVSSLRLHGAPPAKHVIECEKPWHRLAALTFAAGAVTVAEVARAVGVSEASVRNLLRNEWFQEKVTQLMLEHGGRDIMELFKAEGMNSLITLVELRDSEKVSATVRATCARDILDRALGKPLQRVETTNEPRSDDPVREVRQLEEANSRLRSQLPADTSSASGDVLRNPGEPQQPT